jgi:hypothetical protein
MEAPMTIEQQAEITENRIKEILHNWHEAGRAEFEANYPNLNFDSPDYSTHFHVGAKYIRLDVGSSGAFLLDSTTGLIYGIKGYGQVDKKKVAGDASDPNFTGASLYNLRFKRGAFNFAGRS